MLSYLLGLGFAEVLSNPPSSLNFQHRFFWLSHILTFFCSFLRTSETYFRHLSPSCARNPSPKQAVELPVSPLPPNAAAKLFLRRAQRTACKRVDWENLRKGRAIQHLGSNLEKSHNTTYTHSTYTLHIPGPSVQMPHENMWTYFEPLTTCNEFGGQFPHGSYRIHVSGIVIRIRLTQRL